MSFDLYFCPRDGSAPSVPHLRDYFSSRPLFQVNDVPAGGVEFLYENEATGVYCVFSYSPLDAEELEGCGSSGLTFNLNFSRPSFFAFETMPLVEAFCKHFDLMVEDPQAETVQSADASVLISSWRAHNAAAMGALRNAAISEEIELYYLSEESATAWWRYMKIRQDIENAITEDIYVPSLWVLMNPAHEVFTLMTWPKGIPQFFPRCDFVYVQRDRKRLFGRKEETGIVSYATLMGKIDHLLDDYEIKGLRTRYLRPEKAHLAVPLIQSLDLQPIDLTQHTRLSAHSFHDVVLPELA